MGGNHVMPTYLDQHICEKTDKAFQPGDRWKDAGECKKRFKEIKTLAFADPPFDEHMYIMQNIHNPPCCETCKALCSGYGKKQVVQINNELRYLRVGHKKVKFTGDAAGFNALRPGWKWICCCHWPCYLLHSCCLGTYKKAYNQYVDNHLEWATSAATSTSAGKDGSALRDLAAGKTGNCGSAKIAPAPEEQPSQMVMGKVQGS
jgi:hypothetical protein